MFKSLKDGLFPSKNLDKSLVEGPSTDDKGSVAPSGDERTHQTSAPDNQYHAMSDHRHRRGSRPSIKASKSHSTCSTSRPDNFQRRPSFPLSKEPEPIETEPFESGPTVQSLYEQLEEKDRACDRLRSINQGLKADLLKHLSDPYAKHRCSDGEILGQYEDLLHLVEQTARSLCDSMGNDPEALVEAIHINKAQERIKIPEQLLQFDKAIELLGERYRGKFFQRSVAEMLLFRALLRLALPPRILSTSLTQAENNAGKAFLEAMMVRAKLPDEDADDFDKERLSQLEKWRLDTVDYVSQHESAGACMRNNKQEMLRVLRGTFKSAEDNPSILEDLVDKGLDFARVLQKQKSIYYFDNLLGEFYADHMDFQDPRQAEYLQDSDELEPERVLIGFYPVFFKMAPSEPIVMAKGKALFSPHKYN